MSRRPVTIIRTDEEILEQIRLHLIQILQYIKKRHRFVTKKSEQDLTTNEYQKLIYQQIAVTSVSANYQIKDQEVEHALTRPTLEETIDCINIQINSIDDILLEFLSEECHSQLKNGIDPNIDSDGNYSESEYIDF